MFVPVFLCDCWLSSFSLWALQVFFLLVVSLTDFFVVRVIANSTPVRRLHWECPCIWHKVSRDTIFFFPDSPFFLVISFFPYYSSCLCSEKKITRDTWNGYLRQKSSCLIFSKAENSNKDSRRQTKGPLLHSPWPASPTASVN